jgi:uncharacterized membrane protein YdjX (TVP38/TMEM64 family)
MMAALAAILFLLAAIIMPHSPASLRRMVAGFGWWATLVYAALWVVLTPALFSGTILAAGAGLLFGPLLGTALGVAGATGGALLSFSIARRWGARSFAQIAPQRVKAVEDRVNARPFRSVLILRVMPGMPATWLNYVAGLTRIPVKSFAAASIIGAAPRILIYAGLAGSVGRPSAVMLSVSVVLFVILGAVGVAAAIRERHALAMARR